MRAGTPIANLVQTHEIQLATIDEQKTPAETCAVKKGSYSRKKWELCPQKYSAKKAQKEQSTQKQIMQNVDFNKKEI